jgi:hypothetical protein
MSAIAEYFKFFDQHRIWLPQRLCGPLEEFAKQLRTPTIHAGVYLDYDYLTEQTAKEKLGAWTKAWDSVQTDVPKLRNAIEAEFRELLGVTEGMCG